MPRERQRRHHRRSRNGCSSCKQRHMRCDETKPFCRNCLKNGGPCGYRDADSAESSTVNSPTADASPIISPGPPPENFVGDEVLNIIRTQTSNIFDQSLLSPTQRRLSQLLSYEQLPQLSTNKLSGGPNGNHPESLPIVLSPESRMLLSHLDNYRVLLPEPVRKTPGDKFTVMAISDPGILHAALVLAASHWIFIGGQKNAIERTLNIHKMEAIRIVNDNLGNPATAISDSVVGSITCLVFLECLHGSIETAAIHFKGLEQIVRMRGDLHSGTMNDLLQRAILLSDVLNATAINSQPHFQETYIPRNKFLSNSSQSPEEPKVNLHCLDEQLFSETNNVDSDITKMFVSLRWQSNFKAITDFECPEENSIRNGAIDRTEIFINELIRSHKSSTRPSRSGVCIQAGYIYLHLFLRRCDFKVPIFDPFVTSLKEELEKLQLAKRERFSPVLLFWILSVGASAAIGRPEHQWFTGKLLLSREKLALTSWEEAKKKLGEIAWIDGWNEPGHVDLWTHLDTFK